MEARYNKDNWVLNENGEPRQVEGYNHSSLWLRVKGCEKVSFSISKNKVKPILLTEEILLKCGFEKEVESSSLLHCLIQLSYDLEVKIIYSPNDTKPIKARIETWSNDWDDLSQHTTSFWVYNSESLHQLQNLFFSLTGEELNIQL